jgi:hypothetical protein
MSDTLWLVLEFLVFGLAIGGVVLLAEVFKDPKR